MPRFHFPVQETQRSISRPIAIAVVRRMLPIWGFASGVNETRITLYGETETIPATHSTLDPEPIINRLFNDNNVRFDVAETYASYVGPYEAMNRQDMPPIFWDKELEVWLIPQLREREVTITVTLSFRDRTHAMQSIQIIQGRVSAYGMVQDMDVDYHYPIPVECTGRLIELWKLRESKYPTGESLADWFLRCFDARMEIVRNQGEKGHQFVIDEKQVGIQGWHEFDSSSVPQAEAQTQGNNFQVNFTYKYTYMKPEHVLIQYPLVIYNTMIPEHLIDKRWVEQVESFYRFYDTTGKWLSAFKQDKIVTRGYYLKAGVPIPFYDDWQQYVTPRNMYQVFRLLLQVDDADHTSVINLTDIPGWNINPDAINYLKANYQTVFTPFNNVFYFSLYRYGVLVDQTTLSMDADLNITFPSGMDVKGVWHCTFAMINNPRYLSTLALQRLLASGLFAIKWLNTLSPGLGDKLILLPNGSVAPGSFKNAIATSAFSSGTSDGMTRRQVYGSIFVCTMPRTAAPAAYADGKAAGEISATNPSARQIAADKAKFAKLACIAEAQITGEQNAGNDSVNGTTEPTSPTDQYTEYSRADV